MIKKIIILILNYSLKPFFNIMLKLFNTVVIFRFGNALGDQVYMSSVLREINVEKKKNIILFTNFDQFYKNNIRIKILIKSTHGTFISFLLNNV